MRGIAILAALLISIASATWADHAPDWQISTKKPEASLAGIRVGKTSIEAARRALGEPTRFRDLPDFPGEAEYIWEQPKLQLVLGTDFDPQHRTAKNEVVYSVKIKGAKASKKYVTRAGVGLGDSLGALIHSYGPVYSTSWRPSTAEGTVVTFIFHDETELSATLSEKGRVVALALLASQE